MNLETVAKEKLFVDMRLVICDEKGPGMKYTQHHDWQKGFAIAHIVNDYPHIQMIHIAPDYSCVVDGKTFSL